MTRANRRFLSHPCRSLRFMPTLALSSADWTAIGTMSTAVIAAVAASVAYFQVRVARQARDDRIRPFVVVDIRPSASSVHILNLVVENVGLTLARNVTIKFDPPLATSEGSYRLAESALLTTGIPSLPPGRRIEAFFDSAFSRNGKDLPDRFDVTVTYDDAHGRRQPSLSYIVDFSYLFGLQYMDEKGLHDIAKSVAKLADTAKDWTSGGRLRVSAIDDDARQASDRLEREITGHYPSLGRDRPPEWAMKAARSLLLRPLVRSALARSERRAEASESQSG